MLQAIGWIIAGAAASGAIAAIVWRWREDSMRLVLPSQDDERRGWRVVIDEGETAVRFVNGIMAGLAKPGVHWHLPWRTKFRLVETRSRWASIPGQEVLAKDGVGLRASLAARYRIVDPVKALTEAEDIQDALYLTVQTAFRDVASGMEIGELLEKRGAIGAEVTEQVKPALAPLGIEVHAVFVKDIMFPGKLKETFAKIVEAKKEGQAVLERARGETAAIRHLANSAQLLESRPVLLQLRLLQAVAESNGHTFVFGEGGLRIGTGGNEES